jgi:peptidoglycan/LPS O-acetylase OafA/YrhL
MMLALAAPSFLLGVATGIAVAWTHLAKRKILFVVVFITFAALSLAAVVFKDVSDGSFLWYNISAVITAPVARLVMKDRFLRPNRLDDPSAQVNGR